MGDAPANTQAGLMGNGATDKVVSLEAARVERYAIAIAKREAKKNGLDNTATEEAVAWAAYVATWVGFGELEKLVVEFCAGVFLPPRDWPAADWIKRSAVHTNVAAARRTVDAAPAPTPAAAPAKKRATVASAAKIADIVPFPPRRA